MTRKSLRILVVEDDYLVAAKLQREITAAGDVVVGPFADVHEAMGRVGLVQAAILDVKVGDETSFGVADSLRCNDVPFVFLTGYDAQVIPQRFQGQRFYAKPSHADPMLHELHEQHRGNARHDDDSMEAIVLDMIHRACILMPDRASADRLVEAALLRAIAESTRGRLRDDMQGQLMGLVDDEYRRRGRAFLN